MGDEIREKHEALLDRMIKAGWLYSYLYEDAKGVRFRWTPDGHGKADNIKGLASLYIPIDRKQWTNFIDVPDGLAQSLIWKRTVGILEPGFPRLTLQAEVIYLQ